MASFTITDSYQRTIYSATAVLADMPLIEKSFAPSTRFRPEQVSVSFEYTAIGGWRPAWVALSGPRILKDGSAGEDVRDEFFPASAPAWTAPIVEALAPAEEPIFVATDMSTGGQIDPPQVEDADQASISGFDPAVGEHVCVLTARNMHGQVVVDEAPAWTAVVRVTQTLVITADGRRWARGSDTGTGLVLKNTSMIVDSARRLVPSGHPDIDTQAKLWEDQGRRAR